MADKPFIHPYIPNSVPATKQAMLDELGLSSVEEIYAEIPERLRCKVPLDIPPAILSERELRTHVQGLLDKNASSVDFLNSAAPAAGSTTCRPSSTRSSTAPSS